MSENDTLMFECIQERDIDLLLMEEWCVNPEFARFFLKKIVPSNFNILNRTAMHSITDDAYGENDIVLTFQHGEQHIAVLVEDKIAAVPQPNQAKRYQLRAEKMKSSGQYDEVFICIVAPQHYLDNDTEQYPNSITYESLADYLANGTPRGEYKANMLRLGISQERRHPKPVKNELVTKFWQDYYNELKLMFPEAIMAYPQIVPINSDWPMIRFPEFPDKTRLVHKMAQGNLDLETGLSEANLRSILSSWNKESIMVVQTGKSFVLRIPVPQLNRLEGFSAQMAIVSEVFSGISLFRDCMVEYGLKQKERTHVSAMEHVKATPDEVKATKTEKNTTINKEV